MIYVLLEKQDNLINSFYTTIQNKVHKSCVKRVSKKTTYETIKSYKQPPLLSSGWLLMVANDITVSQLKILVSLPDSNIILFHVTSKKALSSLSTLLENNNVAYSLINNYTTSKEDVVEYICEHLDISKEDAKYLAKRQK